MRLTLLTRNNKVHRGASVLKTSPGNPEIGQTGFATVQALSISEFNPAMFVTYGNDSTDLDPTGT